MANIVTDYGQAFWSQLAFGLVTPPTSYWLALANTEPGQSVDGTQFAAAAEVQAVDYARVEIPAGAGNWALSSSGFVANLNRVFIGAALNDWGVINYAVLCTDDTAGNLYAYSVIDNASRVDVGMAVALPPGALAYQTSSVLPSIAP